MQVRIDPSAPPTWPPLLATRGPGARSAPHAHHAMHLVVCVAGELRFRADGARRFTASAGVLTGADVEHEIDARGRDVLLVFVDPESAAGETLRPLLAGPVRPIAAAERAALLLGAEPRRIMGEDGPLWAQRAVALLGGPAIPARRRIHPRVRRLLRLLPALPAGADTSLAALAEAVGLSPSRLMHAFSESIGLPLRPYLAWLRLQRAAAAIVTGAPLARAAVDAGFADGAHMTRSFRRMLGLPPSALRAQM